MKRWREQAAEGVRAGAVFSFSRTFTDAEVSAFGDLTRDYNPVHCDPEFAKLKGFDRTVCHGLLTASMMCEIGGQLAWLASGMKLSFLRPVRAGDTVTCTLTVGSVDERGFARADFKMVRQDGAEAVCGTLEGYLPGPAEKERLAGMASEGDPTNKLRSER